MNKSVEKKDENTSLVAAGMFEDDANTGFEDADADAYAIPFLTILQALSPQCNKTEGAYIEGAEQGEFFNPVSEDRFNGEDGIQIIPVHFKRAFVEWKPRNSSGGFVADHNAADGPDRVKPCRKNHKKTE